MSLAESAAGAPPPIPASHTGDAWLRGTHALVWTHTGTARVRLEDGRVHVLTEGEGIWVPAHVGRQVGTDRASLAFPYWIAPEAVPGAPSRPVRFAVRDAWRHWLIGHYAHLVAPIASFGYRQATLLDVLAPSATAPTAASPARDPRAHPPMPTSAGARTVAAELLRNPALDHTAEEWTELVACSVRTLRREFLRDTGLTFARWRTRCRLAAARELLAAGYDIGQIAARTGFLSRTGLTRAFRAHYGMTPRDFAARARRQGGSPSGRVAEPAPPARPFPDAAAGRGAPEERRELPVTRTALHVNDVHVLVWTYRGTGYVRANGTTYPRRRGEASWIPAGLEHQAGTPENSVSLPLGYLAPEEAHFAVPLRARFPASWDVYLLHHSVSTYTRLRPEGHDHRRILEIFHERRAADRAQAAPLPRDPRARAVAGHFLRRMHEPAHTAAVDRAVREAFRRETGLTLTAWQHATRMHAARELLAGGAKPSSVARQVGYTQLSNFSRAFSRFHGESPRDYQRREHAGEATEHRAPPAPGLR